jgi:selenoprotein W-related protein
MKPIVSIIYCPRCKWLLRSAYIAQEFLTTFEEDLHGVLLQPSALEGQFSILVDEEIVFDRKQSGGFRDIKELKQIIRDKVAPSKSLGHSEKKGDG